MRPPRWREAKGDYYPGKQVRQTGKPDVLAFALALAPSTSTRRLRPRSGRRSWRSSGNRSTSLASRNEPTGTPVSTTALNRTRNVMPSLISPHGRAGRGETSKILPNPAGGLRGGPAGPSPAGWPRRAGPAPASCRPVGDRGDDGVFQYVRLAAVPQRGERLEDDAVFSGSSREGPTRQVRVRTRRGRPPAGSSPQPRSLAFGSRRRWIARWPYTCPHRLGSPAPCHVSSSVTPLS